MTQFCWTKLTPFTISIQYRDQFNIEGLNFCFENYINSELDFQTPGERGLGRMSSEIPRLGGYFRKQMSRISQQEHSELYRTIQDLMLRGYLMRVLLMESPPKCAVLADGTQIFETWIAGFYVSDPMGMGEDLRNAMAALTNSAFTMLMKFYEDHGMRGGGFMSKDKAALISAHYPPAGYVIRAVEVGEFVART